MVQNATAQVGKNRNLFTLLGSPGLIREGGKLVNCSAIRPDPTTLRPPRAYVGAAQLFARRSRMGEIAANRVNSR
jgi:hypothetical protein